MQFLETDLVTGIMASFMLFLLYAGGVTGIAATAACVVVVGLVAVALSRRK